jgi:hypothetical protein
LEPPLALWLLLDSPPPAVLETLLLDTAEETDVFVVPALLDPGSDGPVRPEDVVPAPDTLSDELLLVSADELLVPLEAGSVPCVVCGWLPGLLLHALHTPALSRTTRPKWGERQNSFMGQSLLREENNSVVRATTPKGNARNLKLTRQPA